MILRHPVAWLGLLGLTLAPDITHGQSTPLAEYFRIETERIAAKPLLGIDSAETWKQSRPELQRRFREMLGLDPLPPRTDLNAHVTGTVERTEFAVDRLIFESSPGLFVTANLYRPKDGEARHPAILYVCGHAKVEKDGVIYGSKAHYQHHAAWFAANGYVCLVLDTLQLGELPGLHHGTHHLGMWWWMSRGYTPAGIEAWNGIPGRGCARATTRARASVGPSGRPGGASGSARRWFRRPGRRRTRRRRPSA